jgi:DNA-binding transcriptional regulator YdaS (Cro superfamily)
MIALDRAIAVVGTQTALAEALGIKSPSISEWRSRGTVPVERCPQIEEATRGAVTRYDLRPDVFGKAPKHERAA